ncbi:MAG: hypothetical protein N2449_06705 [Bacteroidales bacterium]|nr:hypothetical protein [Bacteroidales bacterium]
MFYLEIIGYVASIIIALSIAMTSVVKFRIFNAIGAFIFSTYGFIIGAYPVGVLNGFITIINVYYLYKFFTVKETFELLETDISNPYVKRFLEYYQTDIYKFFPNLSLNQNSYDICILMLRNMHVAGLFLAHYDNNKVLWIDLDYVIKEYRDLKNGKHLYRYIEEKLKNQSIFIIRAKTHSKIWNNYIKQFGFSQTNDNILEKKLSSFS